MEPSTTEKDQLVKQVRALIADTNTTNPLLSDEQIETYLALNDWMARLAAAEALEAIAVSEVLVSKKIATQDLTTDGAAVAKELRALAAQLRARARDEDPELGAFDGFDLAPVLPRRRPELTEDPYPKVWGL